MLIPLHKNLVITNMKKGNVTKKVVKK